ncbi:MAG: SDR family oxidoreductase [Deltaproteobacteria bacterium]|nr:SDR family oxidoreductase [Deltaproteobacteria bacterium]
MRLQGRNALVTGAGAGIGKAVAQRFAFEGARVVVSDIQAAAGEAVVESIGSAGGVAHFIHADVSRESDVQHLVGAAVQMLGGLHIAVNNAGIELVKPMVELTEAEWDRIMAVNVKGVFFGCKYAAPAIEASGGGTILNMASAAGLIGQGLLSAYCATKGAVIAFTRALAQEYRGRGLRFNALCPMLVDTELGDRFVESYEYTYGVPISELLHARQGRMITADEVASNALFLVSDESSFVNGHALVLDDGGISG